MKLWVDPWAGLKSPGVVDNAAAKIKVSSALETQDTLKSILSGWPPLENLLFRSRGSAIMKSVEIICCLFIIIFALAVAHPLPDNVLEQVQDKEVPPTPANNPKEPELKHLERPALLFEEPTAAEAFTLQDPPSSAPVLQDPPSPVSLLQDPPSPVSLLQDPPSPVSLLQDPPSPVSLLQDPPSPVSLLQDPPSSAPVLQDPPSPVSLLQDPPSPVSLLQDPPSSAPVLQDPPSPVSLLQDPPSSAPLLQDPPSPVLLLQDPPSLADMPMVSANDNAPSVGMIQDGSQQQQDSEAMMLSQESLEARAQDSKLQKE
ncbi:variable charge X-linked protein 3B-like [Erythrolamprus reginae]|uniref:variable charge X-linked protein 3B-like n=1 Tax=Erythrolamprus reginae TaxID=121349 RepID=UPI00396CA113